MALFMIIEYYVRLSSWLSHIPKLQQEFLKAYLHISINHYIDAEGGFVQWSVPWSRTNNIVCTICRRFAYSLERTRNISGCRIYSLSLRDWKCLYLLLGGGGLNTMDEGSICCS